MEKEKGEHSIVFWNVAGLNTKNKEFWRALRERDIIILLETWVDKRSWVRIK